MGNSNGLDFLIATCERLKLRFFITGSMATIVYGEPRMTRDVDVVVALDQVDVGRFLSAFSPEEYYFNEEAVREAVRTHTQFNILLMSSGFKFDVMVPDDSPFNRSRFDRIRLMPLPGGLQAPMASPEDVILKKMEYYREGESEKHLRDIAGVMKIQGDQIDRAYIEDWSRQLGLMEVWGLIQHP